MAYIDIQQKRISRISNAFIKDGTNYAEFALVFINDMHIECLTDREN